MYNLRYHITSLVAVFLALAIGLVLGGVVVERGTLDAQRTALVNSLRKDFQKLSNENKSLQSRLALESGFARAAQGDAVKGRLDGKRVALVTNSGRADAAQPTRKALEQAGAKVAVVTVEKPGFGLSLDATKKALESRLASGTPVESGSIIASLAAEWTTGTAERPITDALLASGVFTAQDLDSGAPVDGVVIVATFDGGPDASVIDLGRAFVGAGKPAVAAETYSQKLGLASAAKEAGLGADNAVDLASGAWSIVEMMSGGKLAFYGHGAEVDAPFPSLPPFQAPASQETTPAK